MNDSEIDRAATAGFDSYSNGNRIPGWVVKDDILAAAWACGRRQAADRSADGSRRTAHHIAKAGDYRCPTKPA